MEFAAVVRKLKEYAPLSLAESWDNVGVLVEPPDMRSVSKLLLTNDLTLDVMDEAVEQRVEMILSYHPPIFKPLKSITTDNWKERIIGRCLAHRISVFSPHTSYDSLVGGVNDWLIQAFGSGHVKAEPVSPSSKTETEFNRKIDITLRSDQTLNNQDVEQSLDIRFGSAIWIAPNRCPSSISVYCTEKLIPEIISYIGTIKPKSLFIVSNVKEIPVNPQHTGSGRKMTLSSPITLRDAVAKVQTHLNLSHVRLAVKYKGTQDDLINSVAVCAGSGASVLRGVKADLLLTGEMSHHEVLDMTQRGISLILTDHSNSERGFLSAVLRDELTTILEHKVKVIVSEKDADPLQIV